MSDLKVRQLCEAGDRRAGKLEALIKQPAKFLATIQVAITLAGFLQSAFAAENFAQPLVTLLRGTGIPVAEEALKSACIVVITLILAYFNLVFGELVPKRVAMKKAEELRVRDIIGSKYPKMDMISFGPTICYPHSPDEKVEIASVGKFYEFMVDTLRNIPKK